MPIHPTALIDARAEVHPEADIGPFVVIDGAVRVGPGTRVLAHATLTGEAEIGADNVIHMGAVLGHVPQDLTFSDSQSYLRVGDRNVIREHVQIHRGTQPGSATVVGSDNYLMASAHARATNLRHALAELEAGPCTPEVRDLIDFIRASKRSVCRGRRWVADSDAG